jgi:hypothetical protein
MFKNNYSSVSSAGVQLGAMKLYVAAVGALKKNERQDETLSTYHQNCWNKLSGSKLTVLAPLIAGLSGITLSSLEIQQIFKFHVQFLG